MGSAPEASAAREHVEGEEAEDDSERDESREREEEMGQQTIFGRIAQLTKANIHALIDAAEDPETMLDQMIRDYKNNIAEAEEAVAQTIGNLRLMEQDSKEASDAAAEWGSKAQAAVNKAKELTAAGNATEAGTFGNLARVALKKQIAFEDDVKDLQPTITQQNEVVNKLKAGLEGMRGKLDELESKRDELIARAKMAEAQSGVMDAVKGSTSPTRQASSPASKRRSGARRRKWPARPSSRPPASTCSSRRSRMRRPTPRSRRVSRSWKAARPPLCRWAARSRAELVGQGRRVRLLPPCALWGKASAGRIRRGYRPARSVPRRRSARSSSGTRARMRSKS